MCVVCGVSVLRVVCDVCAASELKPHPSSFPPSLQHTYFLLPVRVTLQESHIKEIKDDAQVFRELRRSAIEAGL